MTVTTNGVSSDFEWVQDYDALLDQIASTDAVDSEWSVLRDMIKYKLDLNINKYLDNIIPPRPSDPQTEKHSQSSPPLSTVSSLSSPTIGPHPPSTAGGMIRPPFPARGNVNSSICETLPGKMTREQATRMKEQIFGLLDDYERNPPFTIQRVCQLCLCPDLHYKSVGKYLRAVERSLLVTSTWDMFPPLPPSEEEYAVNPASASSRSLRESSTPLFSPIPFLHQDARSRSPSPLTIPSSQTAASSAQDSMPMLGLVDELDSPSPGHLSEKPTALTATSVQSSLRPLNERFVKGEADPPDAGQEDAASKSKMGEEDQEVENMVLEPPEPSLEV